MGCTTPYSWRQSRCESAAHWWPVSHLHGMFMNPYNFPSTLKVSLHTDNGQWILKGLAQSPLSRALWLYVWARNKPSARRAMLRVFIFPLTNLYPLVTGEECGCLIFLTLTTNTLFLSFTSDKTTEKEVEMSCSRPRKCAECLYK